MTACGSSSSRFLANQDEKVTSRAKSWHDVKLSDGVADPLTQATSDAKVLSKSVVTTQKDASEQSDSMGRRLAR